MPAVTIRPIRPEDKAALLDGLARMSETSRYRRFLTATPRLGPSTLAYLTEVDHHDHEALVAVDASDPAHPGVGVARYVRDREHPEQAEVAVAVVDGWHRRGVGTELLERLTERARKEGIERFVAIALADNQPVLSLVRHLDSPVRFQHRAPGEVAIVIDLPPARHGAGEPLRRLLRGAARGRLWFRPPPPR